jgi:hypothetical protein
MCFASANVAANNQDPRSRRRFEQASENRNGLLLVWKRIGEFRMLEFVADTAGGQESPDQVTLFRFATLSRFVFTDELDPTRPKILDTYPRHSLRPSGGLRSLKSA